NLAYAGPNRLNRVSEWRLARLNGGTSHRLREGEAIWYCAGPWAGAPCSSTLLVAARKLLTWQAVKHHSVPSAASQGLPLLSAALKPWCSVLKPLRDALRKAQSRKRRCGERPRDLARFARHLPR